MIKLVNVTKYYGRNLGIENVSFEAKENEIIGLLGRNGAGKTTTMNIITGYISSTEGSVVIDGYDILKNPQEAKAKIGYLPEKPPIYMDMTVDEYLIFCSELKGIDKELIEKHINEICNLVGINEIRKRLCKNLSKGYKQRVGLVQALVGNPDILILDEPTIGLDPNQIIQIRELIKAIGKKHTIIISSHILAEIEQVCERVIILDNGKIVASDTLEKLTKSYDNQKCLELRIKDVDESYISHLQKAEGVLSVNAVGTFEKDSFDFIISYEKHCSARENIFNIVAKDNKTIVIMRPKEATLEDVFLNVTKSNRSDG